MLRSVHAAYFVSYIVSLKIFRRPRPANIFLENCIFSSPNLNHSYRRKSLGYLSRYSEYSQKLRKRASILERGKRFFPSVQSTDRFWAPCGRLSSRVSLTNFLRRTAGGTWIGLPPLFSAKLTSARLCGLAVLLFFTALCSVKCREGCTWHRTVWCNLIHKLTIYRLTCWYNWRTLLNNQLFLLSISLDAGPKGRAV